MHENHCPAEARVSKDLENLYKGESFDTYDDGILKGQANDDIFSLIDKIKQEYGIRAEDELPSERKPIISKENSIKDLADAFNVLKTENTSNVECKDCAKKSTKIRVESVRSFQRGQHIVIPGKYGLSYIKILDKQMHFYEHHAIIKKVKSYSGTRVELVLIHFTDKNETRLKIQQTDEIFDLVYDEIKIVQYTNPRHDADHIVRTAEAQLKENGDFKTWRFWRNCEHFVTFCVRDEQESEQVNGLKRATASILGSLCRNRHVCKCFVNTLIKCVSKILFISSDEIALAITNGINVPGIILTASGALYLIYCIIKTCKDVLINYKGQRNLCWSCLKKRLIDLWGSFTIYGTTSVVSYLISNIAVPLVSSSGIVPLSILLILLSCVMQMTLHEVWRMLRSPFTIDKLDINKVTDICKGDIVSLPYYRFAHEVIVIEVISDRESPDRGQIRGVHYGTRSLFGTREIMEEVFEVNLSKSSIRRFDCKSLLCFDSEEVVNRVMKRVGETKWSLFSSRSEHLCFWAKVRPRQRTFFTESKAVLGPSQSRTFSTFAMGDIQIHLMEEIQPGDLVYYKKYGLVVELSSLDDGYGRKFQMYQIIYDKGRLVRKKKYTINLQTDNIYVKHMHAAHCYPMETRLERAKQWLDKKGLWYSENGFFYNCIICHPV